MKISRVQLYEEIWSTPVSTLAKKYGVSDTAIRKKCDKYNIPKPDNKYWGRLRAGHAPIPPPLPEFDGDDEISFVEEATKSSVQSAQEIKPAFYGYDADRRALLLHIRDSLKVDSELSDPHPVIVSHQNIYPKVRKERGNSYKYEGRINMYSYDNELDTSKVSESAFPRLYRILNALFNAIEHAGGAIVRENHITIIIEQFQIRLNFTERCSRQRLPEEQRRNSLDDGWRFTPTGFLTMEMRTSDPRLAHDPSYRQDITLTWKETKTKRFEDDLPSIFQTLMELPQYMEDRYQSHQERLRRQAAERERLDRLQRLHDDEFEKSSQLVYAARMWETAQLLKRYIAGLEEALRGNLSESSDEIQVEIEWAKKKAMWLDPLSKDNDPILTEKDKLRLIKY